MTSHWSPPRPKYITFSRVLPVVLVQLLSCVQLFCDPMDCSPPGSSVHGISQARILEWVAISFSRGSFRPRNGTHVSCIGRWVLYHLSHLGKSILPLLGLSVAAGSMPHSLVLCGELSRQVSKLQRDVQGCGAHSQGAQVSEDKSSPHTS